MVTVRVKCGHQLTPHVRKCVTGRLYNSNNIATSAALAKVCALLSAILDVYKHSRFQ